MENNTKSLDHPRKWWLAGVLSYLVPGLGQVYNGEAVKGLLFYCLLSLWGSIVFVFGVNMIKREYSPFHVFLLFVILAISLSAILLIIIDAIRSARKQGTSYSLKSYNKWVIYLAAILLSQGVDYSVRTSIREILIKPYRIPTVSMAPTLLTGDFLLSNKIYYCSKEPKRGEIIVLKYPQAEEIITIKRIIGLPGDTLQIRNKEVFINGNRLNEPYVVHNDSRIFPKGSDPRDNFGSFIVPPNHYFVMGDNRDNSLDSRYWGTIERTKIEGKPNFIYWSWQKKIPFVRFLRIGKKVM